MEISNIKLTFFKLKDYKFQDFKNYPFSLYDQKRAQKFLKQKDKENFLIQRALLEKYLKKVLKENQITISYTTYGKPYLEKNPLCFNIAHSSDFFMIGISSFEIGVDIETIKPTRDLNKLSLKVLSPIELKVFHTLDDSQKELFFYQIWTQKEAYLKCLGTGIRQRLNAITVSQIKDVKLDFKKEKEYFWASAIKL